VSNYERYFTISVNRFGSWGWSNYSFIFSITEGEFIKQMAIIRACYSTVVFALSHRISAQVTVWLYSVPFLVNEFLLKRGV